MSNSIGEVFTALLDDRAGQMSVIVPGEVTAWDSSTETATVAPQLLNRAGDQRPEVRQCPVVFPGAYWDLQVGETGLLLVCDEDFSAWWRTGERATPETLQNHDIGNAVFLAGFRARADARTHVTDAAILDKPAVGGEVLLGDPGATKAALHEDFLPDLNTFLTALDVWGLAVGSAVGVSWTVGGPQASLQAIQTAVGAGDYQSPSVKVED